jgi:hypothetical protein
MKYFALILSIINTNGSVLPVSHVQVVRVLQYYFPSSPSNFLTGSVEVWVYVCNTHTHTHIKHIHTKHFLRIFLSLNVFILVRQKFQKPEIQRFL